MGVEALHRAFGEGGDSRCVGVALGCEDVGTDVPHEEPALPIGEHWKFVPGLAARRLGAAKVIGLGFIERRRQLWGVAHHLVVDGHGVGHRRDATALAPLQAQEADEVRAIRVIGEGRLADFVSPGCRVVGTLAVVGDVAENVSVLVLGPRRSEVHSDSPVEHLHFRLAVAVPGDATQNDEAATVDELAFDFEESLAQRRGGGSLLD